MAVVPQPLLEILILDALRHNLMRPELVAEFVRAFSEETDRARRAAELQVEARRRELGEVARKLDGPVEAMAEGFRAPGCRPSSMPWRAARRHRKGSWAYGGPARVDRRSSRRA
jgi:hypothetical protein